MRNLMTALSFAAFALAAIGLGAAQSDIRVADVKFDSPAYAEAGDVDSRLIADGKDDYPSPTLDDGHPDLRFPGDPRA